MFCLLLSVVIFLTVFGVSIVVTSVPSPQPLSDGRRKFFEEQRRIAAAALQSQRNKEIAKVDYLLSTLDSRYKAACEKGDDRIYFDKETGYIFSNYKDYFRGKCDRQGYILGESGYMESHRYWVKPKN